MAAKYTQDAVSTKTEDALITYSRNTQSVAFTQYNPRSVMMEADRQYMREKDWTDVEVRARLANKRGDTSKLQDIQVPIVMPQVESAVGYLTNVFLTGYPIFGVASAAADADAALQMETIIAENSVTARWAREFIMFFRDGLKYNVCGLECEWGQKATYSIANDPTASTGAKPKQVLWKGNTIRRLDLYNTFWDRRVAPSQVHEKGDYVGYNELLTRAQFKAYTNNLFGVVSPSVVERALKSSLVVNGMTANLSAFGYFIPLINPFPFVDQANAISGVDWLAWANNTLFTNSAHQDYSNLYLVTKQYIRLMPADFGLNAPEANTPQVWKIIIVNGNVVLSAERLTNAHNYIPCFFGQPMEDGLNYQTKSYAGNVSDFQDIATAFMKAYIAGKRRSVTDRVLFDPSRISPKDINSENPSAKIPVRPSAFGDNLEKAVYAFPYRDDQSASLLQGVGQVQAMANLVNSQNPAQQGQFVKGNKTKQEYEDTMGHGNDRNQVIAMSLESQVFVPLKEVIKLNILQFQEPQTITNPETKQQVGVDPVTLRQSAVSFKISDGILPSDKIMSGDEFMTAIQIVGSSPAIGAGYNIAPMFSYLMKQRGADIGQFEKTAEQQQYEQALGAWQNAAAMAAKAGTEFKTPMPEAPQPRALPPSQQPGGGVKAALQSTQGS